MDVITYPCWDLSYTMLVKATTGFSDGMMGYRVLFPIHLPLTKIQLSTNQ